METYGIYVRVHLIDEAERQEREHWSSGADDADAHAPVSEACSPCAAGGRGLLPLPNESN